MLKLCLYFCFLHLWKLFGLKEVRGKVFSSSLFRCEGSKPFWLTPFLPVQCLVALKCTWLTEFCTLHLDLLLCRLECNRPLIFAIFNLSSCFFIKKNHVHVPWFVEYTCNTLVNLVNVKASNNLPFRAFTPPWNSKAACLSCCLDMLPLHPAMYRIYTCIRCVVQLHL